MCQIKTVKRGGEQEGGRGIREKIEREKEEQKRKGKWERGRGGSEKG